MNKQIILNLTPELYSDLEQLAVSKNTDIITILTDALAMILFFYEQKDDDNKIMIGRKGKYREVVLAR